MTSLEIVLLCVSCPGGESILEITKNVTAVLGEDMYLSCRYLGESDIKNAQWKHQLKSKVKSKRMAGFTNGEPFSRNGFSDPDSVTNLTVKMSVSSVEVEGEYICEFETEEEDYSDSLFLTVVGKPTPYCMYADWNGHSCSTSLFLIKLLKMMHL